MPDWAKEIRAAIAPLNLEPMQEAELVEELSQHLRDRYDEMLAGRMDTEQAYHSLLRELNDGALVSELRTSLQAAHTPLPVGKHEREGLFTGIWSDLRFGARLLRKNPGFAMVAILTLALGIGANTTIFQLLDAVRLRTLPVKAPQQLAIVRIVNSPHCCSGDHYSPNAALTGGLWNLVRTQQKAFSEIAAWAPGRYNLGLGGEAHYADTLMVSGEFFNVLGVQPLLGRLIAPADDYRGCGAQGAVLSYPFWQREYGGRSAVLGNKLTLNGHPFQIVGVAPVSFYGMEVGQKFDVAIAICSEPVFSTKGSLMDNPVAWWIATVGRLKPGWTVERASAQLDAISPGIFAATIPGQYDAFEKKDYLSFHLGALPAAAGVSGLRRDYEDPLWLLLALSGLVLLIACANLANLMLARASVRQREMALRLTLGASRSRLIRQLLAESLLLAALGTIVGAVLAQILSAGLVAFLSTQQNPIFVELTPDWRVLGFAAALAILTCILFGLTPAVQASRTDPGVAMKAGGRGATAGRDRFLLRRALVVSQVALSLVLLTGAFLFVRTFRNLTMLNTGFQQDHILIANFDFSPLHLPQENMMVFKRELIARMEAVPGVRSVAEALVVPMSNRGWDDNIDILDGPQRQDVTFNRVSAGYFRTMETPLLAGRDFNQTDTPQSPQVAIVNEAFAHKYTGGANPLGRIFRHTDQNQTYQVVGLVKDTKYYELRENPVPIVFLSFTQANGPDEVSQLMIRSDEPLLPLISSIKRAAKDINPSLVLTFSVLKTQIREGLLRERLMATLSAFFGVLATILAMVGLYGVISYMVARRRNEIGVRIALGANRNNILLMVLREAAILLVIGLGIGTGLALAAGSAAASMLYGLKPRDPLTLGAAIAGMVVVALLASLLPAQRAATVHPMEALREE
ncbi:MAG TPA: ABC transporter permease [Acidobacteriaceae bacterium]|nr:ABC transporter permease [Acidobacteriaceae bacterium]